LIIDNWLAALAVHELTVGSQQSADGSWGILNFECLILNRMMNDE